MKPDLKTVSIAVLMLLGAIVVVDMIRIEARPMEPMPALPVPVTNNAVVALEAGGRTYIVSFAGLGAGKEHGDTHARTFVYDSEENAWREVEPVPGEVGRLAASAVAIGDLAYVFGGYSVAADGSEESTRWVHAFDPVTGTFEQRQPMPVPVDDAIAVVYEDRYIYLVSGWHDYGNVNLVQRYDVQNDSWDQATPTPGRAVFGHAGGIVGNVIVYCDGVAVEAHDDRRREFVAIPECFAGTIDNENPRRIDWRVVQPHPGKPRYRMAAAGSDALGGVLFVGGSDNPYNFDGIGYDGIASQPVGGALLYDVAAGTWRQIKIDMPASMDHRGLVSYHGDWVMVGGMLDDQEVTDRVVGFVLEMP